MKAIDLFRENPFIRVLVYGDSGTGKTTWGALSPRPLMLITEPQGVPSAMVANPDAEVVYVDGHRKFEQVLQALQAGGPTVLDDGQHAYQADVPGVGEVTFQTLVVDSITDVHQKILDANTRGEESNWMRTQATLKLRLDDLRRLRCNLICTALADHKLDDQSRRKTLPMLYGRAATQSGQWFSGVGYAHKIDVDGEIRHFIEWRASSRLITKPAPGWPDRNEFSPRQGRLGTLGSLAMYAYEDIVGVALPRAEGDEAGLSGALGAVAPSFAEKSKSLAASRARRTK